MGRFWEKTQYHFILFLIPMIFSFQMIILLPKLAEILQPGTIQLYIHISLATLLLINISGNMIISASPELNISTAKITGDGFYCDYCKKWRSVDCLHCKKCNMCITRRDHHCSFLSNCIGQYNKRYYILFLGHIALAMTYASCYNYCLISAKHDEDWGALVYIARVINPPVWAIIPEPIGKKDIYAMYMILNAGLGMWAGYLFCYHMRNCVLGVTAYEEKYKPELKNQNMWKKNLIDVFGIKWYWAMIWPFASSPLPMKIKTA